MARQRIKINEDLCTGCGLCVNACQEGALRLIDGKATLVYTDHCDGLGKCLPLCPTDAISFEPVESGDLDAPQSIASGAPSTSEWKTPSLHCPTVEHAGAGSSRPYSTGSELKQWPIQIQLVNPAAPFFQNAHLLIAADCAAFAYRNFHEDYIQGRTIIIGCPKLDDADYAEKLTQILAANDIQSITVVRMEVPCCAGIAEAAQKALKSCGKTIPRQVVTLSLDGRVLDRATAFTIETREAGGREDRERLSSFSF